MLKKGPVAVLPPTASLLQHPAARAIKKSREPPTCSGRTASGPRILCESRGTRTHNPLIKSQMLCQLR